MAGHDRHPRTGEGQPQRRAVLTSVSRHRRKTSFSNPIELTALCFLFGLAAGLARSERKLPATLYEALSVFLLLAIGLKGGKGLAKQALGPLLPQVGAVLESPFKEVLIPGVGGKKSGRHAAVCDAQLPARPDLSVGQMELQEACTALGTGFEAA